MLTPTNVRYSKINSKQIKLFETPADTGQLESSKQTPVYGTKQEYKRVCRKQANLRRAFELGLSDKTGKEAGKRFVNDFTKVLHKKVISATKHLVQKPKQGLCQ
ncbi:hypothetical protein CaldiYA01_23260 [Caldicellulosiruptor diazotrophicus]|uniref:Uncharacterized protein n=1 Tax=Caldicellulosiruptor diazotrophicus TaxID=2806205 RepID=A0ABM7NQC9_9FIRM|nr:hypothetical protein CaldiYA01_23260 [Caldicellulosiruptor diazotrophicus]